MAESIFSAICHALLNIIIKIKNMTIQKVIEICARVVKVENAMI